MKKLLLLGIFTLEILGIQSYAGVCQTRSQFPYSYEYNVSNIGDTITVHGEEYTIVAMPFIEYGTGDHYFIQFPSLSNNKGSSDKFEIETRYVSHSDATCNRCTTFEGYPTTKLYFDFLESYRITDKGLNLQMSVSLNAVAIRINHTLLTGISFGLSGEVYSTTIADGVDFTDNIDWDQLKLKKALTEDLKVLMNHVKIVKIP